MTARAFPTAMVLLSSILLSCIHSPETRASAFSSDEACLAENVYHEARGESAAGMVAVGQVVITRAKSGRSLCSVVHERRGGRCQFTWVCRAHGVSDDESWRRSKAVARALMGSSPPPDPTRGASYFGVCGRGHPAGTLSVAIGRHCFYLGDDDIGIPESGPSEFELVEIAEAPLGVELRVSGPQPIAAFARKR